MGYNMYEIEKQDAMEVMEKLKKAVKEGTEALEMLEEFCDGGEMGMRGGYRKGMGYRSFNMGHRDEEPEYDEYGNPMGMRRGYRRGR